jgi:hypothetical protein
VGWQALASLKFNRWIPRAELIEQGFRKFVIEFDQHLATHALGNDARPLSKESIAAFLDDFGLEPEFSLHSHIRSLSGGCTANCGSPFDETGNYGTTVKIACPATAVPAGCVVCAYDEKTMLQQTQRRSESASCFAAAIMREWTTPHMLLLLLCCYAAMLLLLLCCCCCYAAAMLLLPVLLAPAGGQKVKLVLAAAMWNNPHLLIMDEPTNYLDRVRSFAFTVVNVLSVPVVA